ncbi:phage baseplate assembly protein V [Roseivivax halotolerans]|uniref:Phage baseplate assembly protein V n=1 Tax=Roseivivax halotolerans TaxID=93684 RepID=A0A1I5W3T5_9RHOB|nr:phage baseplate assembly protein V [Roseivivax halotolerans]SFQ14395.1 phage baseplate assembly protein V [Roseivivax halotolerans]
MSSFQAAEADRRISQMVQVGVVTEVSGDKARVRIGDIITPLIPVGQTAMGNLRIKSMPSVGEQRMVFAPGGDMARAMLGLAVSASNTPGDPNEHMIIDLGGAELRITGDIVLTGKLIASEDVIAQGVSLVEHVHDGVTPGNAETKEPVK